MIRIDRSTVDPPKDLCEEKSAGLKEYEKASIYYQGQEWQKKAFPFKAYKSPSVREALDKLFRGKCAYCESPLPTQPPEIEHWRPKGATYEGNALKPPGYWWLAAKWENLLISCIDCNRERSYVVNGTPVKLGKACKFPLAPGSPHASKPGEESLEQPLLIDPCREDPSQYLKFMGNGMVTPQEDASGQPCGKGLQSIEVYGLKRETLVRERKRQAELIKLQMSQMLERIGRLERGEVDPAAGKADLKEQLKLLSRFVEDDQPYLGLAHQLIDPFIRNPKGFDLKSV